jgi:hypothetical protein
MFILLQWRYHRVCPWNSDVVSSFEASQVGTICILSSPRHRFLAYPSPKFKFRFLYNSPIFCSIFSLESYNECRSYGLCANFPVLGTLTYLNETCTAALICTGNVYYLQAASFGLLVSFVVTNNFTVAVEAE